MYLEFSKSSFLKVLMVATLQSALFFTQQGVAQVNTPTNPKLYVGVKLAEDRWITLSDGQKVFQGQEISYLLGQRLLDSGKYIPIFLPHANSTHLVFQRSPERMTQIPREWTQWTQKLNQSSATSNVDLIITPSVETLIYSSGDKSNRVVYGFSPDHINPFNSGRNGSLDNEFIASSTQQQSCVLPDFFNGHMNPNGWGPFSSNFGSNLDEGFIFEIAGFGFGFKRKHYEVRSQIRFAVDDQHSGKHQEMVFQTNGNGQDVFIAGAYSGFTLGIEIQRTKTLLQALKLLLPQVVDSLITRGFSEIWESAIVYAQGGQLILGAGLDENIQTGLQLTSPFGTVYQVASVEAATSTLIKIAGITKPFVGEPLRIFSGQPVIWVSPESTTHMFVQKRPSEKVFTANITLPLNKDQRAQDQQANIKNCFGKGSNWIVETIDALFELYAWWRYDHTFDQQYKKGASPLSKASPSALKIALIDSGIDYNDKDISPYVLTPQPKVVQGYDFISWDNRPSDDNGHGTAAAKLILKNITRAVALIPTKVIGSHGETHSSAIYDGFQFAVNNRVDAVVIPWAPASNMLQAYRMGAELAAQAGIPVFVAPNTIGAEENIFVPTNTTKEFSVHGLGTTLKLSPDGVAAVERLVQWINSNPSSTGGLK